MKIDRRGVLSLGGSMALGARLSTGRTLGQSTASQSPTIDTIWQRGISSPVAVDFDKALYVASTNQVFRIDPTTGGFLSTASIDASVTDIAGGNSGVFVGTDSGIVYFDSEGSKQWNRPVGAVKKLKQLDETVYAILDSNSIIAVDTSGEKIWTAKAKFGYEPALTIHNESVIAIENGAYPASRSDKEGRVVSLSVDDGRENWEAKSTVGSDWGQCENIVSSGGSIYFTQFVTGLGNNPIQLCKITAGNVDFQKTTQPDMKNAYAGNTVREKIVTPAIGGSQAYAQGEKRTLAAFNKTNGDNQWSSSTQIESLKATDGGVITTTISSDNVAEVQKFNHSGLQEWTYQFGSDYPPVDHKGFDGFSEIHSIPSIELGHLFLDYHGEQLIAIGASTDTTEDQTTDGNNDDNQVSQDKEESTPRDSQNTPQSTDTDAETRDLFFPGDDLGELESINATVMSVGGFILSVAGIIYTMVSQNDG